MRGVALVVALILGVIIAVEGWLWPQQGPEIVNPSVPKPGAAGALETDALQELESSMDLAPVEAYDVVNERPLFVEGRRPLPDAPQAPAQPKAAPPPPPLPKQPPPNVALSGIMIIGDERYALLRNAPKDGPSKLRKGDEFQGWVVDKIQADRLLFRQDGEEHEVKLWNFQTVPLPAAPVEAVAAPKGARNGAKRPNQSARDRAMARTRPRPNAPPRR